MANPLRVAIDATPLLGPLTGVGAFTEGLLGALSARAEVEVSAYALSWRGRSELAQRLPAGVELVELPMAARPLREAWSRWDGPTIQWWTGPLDVVHGTNFTVPPARRAASVVTVHDLTFLRFPQMCTPDTRQYRVLVARALRRGSHVHTPSAYVADEVVRLMGADPSRVHAVHHGVPPMGEPAGVPPDEGRRLVGADGYVLALGTVEPRKDLPTLVGAFDAIAGRRPGLRLAIAGPDGWGAGDLADALGRATHRDQVVRFGYVGGTKRRALMRDATLFAFPSLYEGFGFPPLEAMAVGVPVVATTAGSLPEVLGDAACLVPPGDPGSLAAALERVLDDATERARLIERGRARLAAFSWPRAADGLIEVYRRAAEGAG